MTRQKVRDAMHLISREPVVVREEASIYETVQRLIDAPHARSACVVDEQGQLVGIVMLKTLVDHIFAHRYFEKAKSGHSMFEIVHTENAIDLAVSNPVCVTRDDPLEEAVHKIIENGLEEIPVVDDDGNVVGDLNLLELLSVWIESSTVNRQKAGAGAMRLSRYVYEDLIVPRLGARDKQGALDELFGLLAKAPQVGDVEHFKTVVNNREIMVSTGVGKGVAIPHGRCPCIHDGVIVIGLSPEGVAFEALDGRPVHIVMLIAAPERSSFPYAQLLARVVQLLNSEEIKQRLLECQTAQEVVHLLEEFDRQQNPQESVLKH